MNEFVKPDAMGAAAATLERDYCYGCRLAVEAGLYGGDGIFLCHAPDGSEFRLYADAWGNVDRLPDGWQALTSDAMQATLDGLKEARDALMSARHEEWMAQR